MRDLNPFARQMAAAAACRDDVKNHLHAIENIAHVLAELVESRRWGFEHAEQTLSCVRSILKTSRELESKLEGVVSSEAGRGRHD